MSSHATFGLWSSICDVAARLDQQRHAESSIDLVVNQLDQFWITAFESLRQLRLHSSRGSATANHRPVMDAEDEKH